MLKASSMLYAVYVCLIVSIFCCALLYVANLYNILNLFYNSREDMFISNQSAINYWLGSGDEKELMDETQSIHNFFEVKKHGIVEVLITQTTFKMDTLTSINFIGSKPLERTALYVSNFSNPLSFAGTVKLIGDKKLPLKNIQEKFISNKQNLLTNIGKTEQSEDMLPSINPDFKNIVIPKNRVKLSNLIKKEGLLYFNSFRGNVLAVNLDDYKLDNIRMKGNFVLVHPDSISISSSSQLEDVVIISPKVTVENGFKGTIQVFASQQIKVGEQVILSFPSVLCVDARDKGKTEITIGENTKIYGAVVLYGNPIQQAEKNIVSLTTNTVIVGDVYSSGKLKCGGKVYGSVYTNWIFSQTESGKYENCLIDTEINCQRLPEYFVGLQLFKIKEREYEISKFAY